MLTIIRIVLRSEISQFIVKVISTEGDLEDGDVTGVDIMELVCLFGQDGIFESPEHLATFNFNAKDWRGLLSKKEAIEDQWWVLCRNLSGFMGHDTPCKNKFYLLKKPPF